MTIETVNYWAMENQRMLTSDLNGGPQSQSITALSSKEQVSDYRVYLLANNISFTILDSLLLVGELPLNEGWLLHISVVRQQMGILMNNLLGYLAASGFSFIIPANQQQHNHILDGRAGLANVGKIVSIYLSDYHELGGFAMDLINATCKLTGPDVITAVKLGNCVYASIGKLAQDATLNRKYYSPLYGYYALKYLKDQQRSSDISWPFLPITIRDEKRRRLIDHRYLPVQALKNDPKGNVLKCIKLNRFYNMNWCVLKQGKKMQCHDDDGRDMIDRLEWQYLCHRLLKGKVRLPRILDWFTFDDDAWLAIEYFEGVSLSSKINQIHKGTAWMALDTSSQAEMITYLLQVLKIIEEFHRNGLVHRDVSPGNFLVTAEGEIIAIDIELAYNLNIGQPDPPFTVGTPGYISPQQMRNERPSRTDDIFSFGALLIKTFTGLSPNKFNTASPNLKDDLIYFIGFMPMTDIIMNCLTSDKTVRPDLQTVKSCLTAYQSFLLSVSTDHQASSINQQDFKELKPLLEKAVRSLGAGCMLGVNQEWLSINDNDNNLIANESMNYKWKPGFYSGAAGILYTLSIADQFGLTAIELLEVVYRNESHLEKETDNYQNIPAGLWEGSYGVASAIYKMVETGLLPNNIHLIQQIHQLLLKDCSGLNLACGIAGKGLAILYCMDLPKFPLLLNELAGIVSALIEQQESDGAWLVSQNPQQTKIRMIGFAYGTAGITCFLLQYYSRYKKEAVKVAIIKALNWLIGQRIKVGSNWIWSIHSKNKLIDPWLDYGFSGAALTFIKAYEIFKKPLYKEIATNALMIHPKYISSNYLTMANGLAGLGEIYLEAYRAFGEREWVERADHIAVLLLHNCKKVDPDIFCWLESNYSRPSASLMSGNSGVVHFLMRCVYPDKIHFPLLKLYDDEKGIIN